MGWILWFVVRLGILCILDWAWLLILNPFVDLQSTAHGGEPVRPLPHNKIIEIKQKNKVRKKRKKLKSRGTITTYTQLLFFFDNSIVGVKGN